MTFDVSDAMRSLLASNRGPDPVNPDLRREPPYGVRAIFDGERIGLTLTFRRDGAYCCMEWGCHVRCIVGERWDTLRQLFGAQDIVLPGTLGLDLRCVVEEGARFFDFSRPDPDRRGWYEFKSAPAYSYEVSVLEGGQNRERPASHGRPDP